MIHLSDTVIGVSLLAVIAGYVLFSQAQSSPHEAVLGEISLIMNDLESELKHVEETKGSIPLQTNLHRLLKDARNTAIMGKAGDAPLMPDITTHDHKTWLGGCPLSPQNWTVLRMDHSALTEIPDKWDSSGLRICLDRNGADGPNLEGYDVIWLSFSRTGSPHITLIPAHTPPEDLNPT